MMPDQRTEPVAEEAKLSPEAQAVSTAIETGEPEALRRLTFDLLTNPDTTESQGFFAELTGAPEISPGAVGVLTQLCELSEESESDLPLDFALALFLKTQSKSGLPQFVSELTSNPALARLGERFYNRADFILVPIIQALLSEKRPSRERINNLVDALLFSTGIYTVTTELYIFRNSKIADPKGRKWLNLVASKSLIGNRWEAGKGRPEFRIGNYAIPTIRTIAQPNRMDAKTMADLEKILPPDRLRILDAINGPLINLSTSLYGLYRESYDRRRKTASRASAAKMAGIPVGGIL